jgi:hypothetical protein
MPLRSLARKRPTRIRPSVPLLIIAKKPDKGAGSKTWPALVQGRATCRRGNSTLPIGGCGLWISPEAVIRSHVPGNSHRSSHKVRAYTAISNLID